MKSYDVFRDRTRRRRATDDLNEIYRAKCQRLEEENGRLIYMLARLAARAIDRETGSAKLVHERSV